MCGIFGLVEFSASGSPTLGARLDRVAAALEHRGPDGTRVVSDGFAALGCCRLTIRGSAGGFQPLAGPSGVVVVCNGEIDNHRELRRILEDRGQEVRGPSDVDLLPPLYEEFGEQFVAKLEGAFALAVWDSRRRVLLLARDRTGERPLFFSRWSGGVGFASEIRALTRLPPVSCQVDFEALHDFLRCGYFATPSTPFRQVRKLGPAESLIFSEGEVRRERYWRWTIGEQQEKSLPSPEELEVTLRRAVLRQTDNDFPYGIFLSGGLDSALITALAARSEGRRPQSAYCLRFSEPTYDQGASARRVARLLRVPLKEVRIDAGQFPSALERLVARSGEPLADPAWVPTALLSEAAARDVRIALVGEGADELFGGYPTYLGIAAANMLSRLPAAITRAVYRATRFAPLSEKKVPLSFLLRRFADGLGYNGLERHRFWTAAVSDAILARLGVRSPPRPAPEVLEGDALLDQAQRYDLEISLAEGLRTKSDRAAMSNGLELRAPFLDSEVLAFAARIPARQRVHWFSTKVFLKRCARRSLPASIVHARKRGLSVPLSAWLRGPLRSFAHDSLRSSRLERIGIDLGALSQLLDEHVGRRADHARALWALVTLSTWLEWAASSDRDFPEFAAERELGS